MNKINFIDLPDVVLEKIALYTRPKVPAASNLSQTCKKFNEIISRLASDILKLNDTFNKANEEICAIIPALKNIVTQKNQQQIPPTPQKLFMILYNHLWTADCSFPGGLKIKFSGETFEKEISGALKRYRAYAHKLNESFKNEDKVFQAVQNNGLVLQYATDWQNNKKIVLAAVQENHLARNFASDELQIDKEIIAAFEKRQAEGPRKKEKSGVTRTTTQLIDMTEEMWENLNRGLINPDDLLYLEDGRICLAVEVVEEVQNCVIQ